MQKHSFLQHQQPLFSHLVLSEQRNALGKRVPAQFEQSNICSAWLLDQLLYITYLYWWLCCFFSVQSKVYFICSCSWGSVGNDCTWWADEHTTRIETTHNVIGHFVLSKPESQLWSKLNPTWNQIGRSYHWHSGLQSKFSFNEWQIDLAQFSAACKLFATSSGWLFGLFCSSCSFLCRVRSCRL